MAKAQKVQEFQIAHVTFRVTECPRGGSTFCLIAGESDLPERRTKLFSGHIEKGMATALHRLAAHVSTLEERLEDESVEGVEA